MEIEDVKGDEEEAKRRVSEEENRPFDLKNGPVIRWKLVRLNDESCVGGGNAPYSK